MANRQYFNQKPRCRKKLNSIPHLDGACSKSPAIFWYSYQSALTWIRNHENIISKCVQLLQIYPNLIQDASMDQFWDFIESLLHGERAGQADILHIESTKYKTDLNSTTKHQEKDIVKGPDIPHISVTESRSSPGPTFTISAKHARTPRVHLISRRKGVCGSNDDTQLHVGVIDMLQEDFYIRVTNTLHRTQQENPRESRREYILAESDVCVYLFNDATLEDADCFRDLCVALAHKIPIVYVRYHKKELPKTFSETININSKGCITLKDYMDKQIPLTHSASSSSLLVKNTNNRKKLAPLIVGKRSKSASDLYVHANDSQIKHGRFVESLEIDLVFNLVSNFKSACVFDEADLPGCSSRLRQEIHKLLGICESKTETLKNYNNNGSFGNHHTNVSSSGGTRVNSSKNNKYLRSSKSAADFSTLGNNRKTFLSVPDPEDLISTREWGNYRSMPATEEDQNDQEYSSEDCTNDNVFFDNDVPINRSPTSEQKSSTYLIFDHNKAPDGPRKVEFPSEAENADIDSDFETDDYHDITESPISFHEIDLSRQINARGTPESDSSSIS